MENLFNPFQEEIKDKVIKDFSRRDFDEKEFLIPFKGEAQKITINKKVFVFLVAILFLFVCLIVLRLFNLQIRQGDYYLSIAEKNKLRIEPIKTSRGIIYDRNSEPLVKNIPKFSLFLLPKEIPKEKKEEIFEKVFSILGEEKNNFFSILNNSDSFQPILLKESLNYEKALLFEIEKDNLPGIKLEIEQGRQYLAGPEFSHLLGYTGKISRQELEKEENYSYSDEIGKTGVEKYYEKILRGQDGKKRIEIGPDGNEIVAAQEKEKDGENLVLTINLEWQKKLAEIFEREIKNVGARKGAAIILNPKNGEIMALINYPYFDNNLFSRGLTKAELDKIINNPDKPLFFRAISGEYMSGSTIKPVLALAALEEKNIDEETTVLSQGGIKIGKEFFADWKQGGHGLTDVGKALAESVNTFFYLIGGGGDNFPGLGPEKITFYLKKFGLSKKTGIDLPGEKEGFLPNPEWKNKEKNEKWFIGDTYNLSIGHGDIKVTPLQIAYLTMAIANDGKIYQPHLFEKFFNSEINQEFQEINSDQLSFKKENFRIVKEGLREAVLYGTAKALNNLPIKIAGKTGTVETEKGKPHSWFTCFAPFEDPELVLTVLIENGGEGSGPALRVAKSFFNWLLIKE